MPVFSIAAAYIVAEIGGIALAAALGSAGLAFVTSAIAVGLAVVTSRLINGAGPQGSGGTAQDPGVRIQFPPGTANKIPVVYGHAYQKGVVTDARISNSNKTMTYVLVLSEKTQTGTFSTNDIYWNDQKLVFKTDAGSEHIVASSIDQNGTGASNTNFDGLIRVRIYSGDTNSSSQIFPAQGTGNTANARTALAEDDTNYLLNDLVFAVVQIDYDSAKGVTGLAQMTFELTNSLSNPGSVWYDYITSERYGVGIPTAQIDLNSSTNPALATSLYSVSNEVPANQYLAGGTTATNQVRYQINGVISAGDTVKNNLDRIAISSAAWTTFDYSEGNWKVIPNRKATTSELTNAFVFNDDNIIGDIGITATNLEDLYNLLEVEYASRKIRDQNDYFRAEIDPSAMNDLEPRNTLSLRLDLCNNALHSGRIGLIELKQSRVDLIISFRADYSALQCEAGDVVKITTDVYGFEDRLFRLTKIREIEDDQGGITVEITALQYNEDIYVDETLEDSPDTPGSGIPSFGGSSTLPAPSAPVVGNITTGTNAKFSLSSTIQSGSSPVNEIQWYSNTTSTGSFSYLTNEFNGTGDWVAGNTIVDYVTTLQNGTYYFKARVGNGTSYSDLSSISSEFVWDSNSTDYGVLP